jgi:hypothetical protein
MDTSTARKAKSALEAAHAMIYFCPEAAERFAGLGLERGRMSYFAGRAAPMGAVGPGVVAATFCNFNPEAVAAEIPRAWSIASPADVVAARFDAAGAALRRMLGDEVADSEQVAEAARLAREAASACTPEGKPLYAAHADLEWPEPAHIQLWHAVSLLREFRGDAHIAALQDGGLSGLEALVLQVMSGEGLNEQFSKASRGWSDQQWEDAREGLRARGLVDGDGISEKGAALREEVEQATDAMSMAPWEHLGAAELERLTSTGAELSRALLKAGAFPASAFGRD